MEPVALIVIIAFVGPIVGSAIGVMRRPSFTYVCGMLGVVLVISLQLI